MKKFKVIDAPETEDIEATKPEWKIKASDLPTEQEMEWLLEACTNSRDACMIYLPYDAGLREGEHMEIRIGDIIRDEYGMKVIVDGKTGSGPVRIVKSVPTVLKWLDEHPNKSDPTSYLLVSLEKKSYGQPLEYSSMLRAIGRVVERVKKKHPEFTKRIWPTLLRHTETTWSSKIMTDALHKKRHRWSINSKNPARCTHLIDDDVDDVLLEKYGMKKKEGTFDAPKKCIVCEMINDAKTEFCSKCGNALDLKSAIQREEKEKQDKQDIAAQLEDYKKQMDEKLKQFQKQMDEALHNLPDRKN